MAARLAQNWSCALGPPPEVRADVRSHPLVMIFLGKKRLVHRVGLYAFSFRQPVNLIR